LHNSCGINPYELFSQEYGQEKEFLLTEQRVSFGLSEEVFKTVQIINYSQWLTAVNDNCNL